MKKLIAVCGVALAFASCGPGVDVASELQIESVTSGWRDLGTVEGRSKIVPSVSFKLKNVSDQKLPSLQVNAVFRRVGDDGEWGSAWVTASGTSGLAPGSATDVSVRSQLGYTGSDPSHALLTNSHFVDARVDVFAKHGSTQWTRLGEFKIDRQLIAQQP
jgi:hypothetical protein